MKLVCGADTRLKVVVVALVGIPRIAVDAGEEEAAFQIEARNPERTGARAVETDSELIAMLRRRRLEIPAQADVDREARGRFPVVLNERRIIEILPLTGGVDVDAASRGISEQERRERIAGRGIARLRIALREAPAEIEPAVCVAERDTIEPIVPELTAKFDEVPAGGL